MSRLAGLPEDRFPMTSEEADFVDEMLADELSKLSVADHEKILFDVHGLSTQIEEDNEMVSKKLEEMEKILETLPDNQAYMEIKAMDEDYAAQYRLMYLRGEEYNAQSAAEKLSQRFDVKKEYFGGGAILAREIRQSDLSQTAMKVVESGYLVASTVRDSSGRAVIFSTSQYERNSTMRDMGQAVYYYTSLTLKDEETLRSGLVWVFYNLDNLLVSKDYMMPLYRVQKTVPPRLLAIHYIFTDEEILRPFVKGMQLSFAKEDRFRIKPHSGTIQEISFSLQTFGIPTDVSPQQMDGTWSLTWLHEWLRAQHLKEERVLVKDQQTSPRNELYPDRDGETIVIPRRFDVIIGKTSQARAHTGNRRAIHLCEMHFPEYEQAGKFKKTEVAEKIISIIRQSGGRFIKWDEDDGWVEELDEIVARKKIGHLLRYMRSKVTKEQIDDISNNDAKPPGCTEKDSGISHPRKRDFDAENRPKHVTPPSSPEPIARPEIRIEDDLQPSSTKAVKF